MSRGYEVVVGLEVHAELSTKSKIFCGCKNQFGAAPNTLCCPVCTGMPGALPVLNRQVVEYAIMMGHALHCTINRTSKLDRKNYFYPDLPKAYQISQHDVPLCAAGYLDIQTGGETRRIGVERIHIEEDAGKLMHGADGVGTLADYNRCGVPLIEIVSKPDLRGADEAKAYMEGIAAILLHLGISDVKMQEGSVRADVNVSVRPFGQKKYGTRTEMKNVNSFAAVHRAITYEAKRQIEILGKGGVIEQETRRWDDAKGENHVLRTKEDAQDYRYFPDPDQLAFEVPQETVDALRENVPELPLTRAKRYMQEYGLSEYDAFLLIVTKERADFFEAVLASGGGPKTTANWLLGNISKILNDSSRSLADTQLTPENLAGLLRLIEAGVISGSAGKVVLEIIMEEAVDPQTVAEQRGLLQISDSNALARIVEDVLAANATVVADYGAGKANALGYLVGQCMQKSMGQGNPGVMKDLLKKALENQG